MINKIQQNNNPTFKEYKSNQDKVLVAIRDAYSPYNGMPVALSN